MTSLLHRYVSKTEYDSYEDFMENFSIQVPESFNFSYDIIDVYARKYPEKRALVWCNDHGEERFFTFKDLSLLSCKAAHAFRSLGIKKGDRVMLMLRSRYEFWICILALHRLGAVAIPASHMLKEKNIRYRIGKADLKMIVAVGEPALIEAVEKAEASFSEEVLKIIVDGTRDRWLGFDDLMKGADTVFLRPTGEMEIHNDDISLVYFTSGTAGMPKMVEHDFMYPLGHILTAKYWQNVEDDGLHYTVSDTGWAKCAWGKIYGQWIAGTAIFVHDYERFDAKKTLALASKYGVTTFCAPPTVYRFLIKEDMSTYDFSTLHYAVTAGEPLNAEVYTRFLENTGLEIREGFGQSETVVLIATYPWKDVRPGSVGVPSPTMGITLLSKDGKICDTGDVGEIAIDTRNGKPAGLLVGYGDDIEKKNETWHDGYYRTGDLAWKDEEGYFWFVGRCDDMIKTSGYRVSPFEVESALIRHPAVLECAITGIPDKERGQIVKATIKLTNDFEPTDELKKELQSHVKNVTAPYKYPRHVDFVPELPKTVSGKIRRAAIRQSG